jgi:hypothetical protein
MNPVILMILPRASLNTLSSPDKSHAPRIRFFSNRHPPRHLQFPCLPLVIMISISECQFWWTSRGREVAAIKHIRDMNTSES